MSRVGIPLNIPVAHIISSPIFSFDHCICCCGQYAKNKLASVCVCIGPFLVICFRFAFLSADDGALSFVAIKLGIFWKISLLKIKFVTSVNT